MSKPIHRLKDFVAKHRIRIIPSGKRGAIKKDYIYAIKDWVNKKNAIASAFNFSVEKCNIEELIAVMDDPLFDPSEVFKKNFDLRKIDLIGVWNMPGSALIKNLKMVLFLLEQGFPPKSGLVRWVVVHPFHRYPFPQEGIDIIRHIIQKRQKLNEIKRLLCNIIQTNNVSLLRDVITWNYSFDIGINSSFIGSSCFMFKRSLCLSELISNERYLPFHKSHMLYISFMYGGLTDRARRVYHYALWITKEYITKTLSEFAFWEKCIVDTILAIAYHRRIPYERKRF